MTVLPGAMDGAREARTSTMTPARMGEPMGTVGTYMRLGATKFSMKPRWPGSLEMSLTRPRTWPSWRAGMSAVMSVQVAEGPERMGAPLGSRARIH